MDVKIVGLPKAEKALKSLSLPEEINYGTVGRYIEQVLIDEGYNWNFGSGADLKTLGIEVKSRAVEATSAHTVGTMSILDIISTSYDNSPIKEKFQQQLRIKHSRKNNIVTNICLYDFRYADIQNIARSSYELGRDKIIDFYNTHPGGNIESYIRGEDAFGKQCFGYWENTNQWRSNNFDFRFNNHGMTVIEQISLNLKKLSKFISCE